MSILLNNGKYRSKVKEWIRTYTIRLESYAAKYGDKSFEYRHRASGINYKIKEWQKLLKKVQNKPNKVAIARKIVLQTEKICGYTITGKLEPNRRAANVSANPHMYFVCKFIVDHQLLVSDHCPVGIHRDTHYQRRNTCTKWMQESEANRLQYVEYRTEIRRYLRTKQIYV